MALVVSYRLLIHLCLFTKLMGFHHRENSLLHPKPHLFRIISLKLFSRSRYCSNSVLTIRLLNYKNSCVCVHWCTILLRRRNSYILFYCSQVFETEVLIIKILPLIHLNSKEGFSFATSELDNDIYSCEMI